MATSRNILYGPERLVDYSAVREFNLKDNVLKKCDYDCTETNWTTHYDSTLKDSFQKYENVAKERNFISSKRKHHCNRPENLIGHDASMHFALTSKDYGEHRSLRSPATANVDKEIHIVDFSPKFNTVPTIKSSVYKSCYNNASNLRDSYNDRLETSQRTKDVRLTHFDFGTGNERLSTETTDSFNETLYKNNGTFAEKLLEKEKNKSLHRSNIFQNGDWNAASRSLANRSVTAEQFGIKKLMDQKEPNDHERSAEYSNLKDDIPDFKRTHINFGKNKDLVTSFYRKDFMIDKRKPIEKREIAGPPTCSKVIQRNDSLNKIESINRTDYLNRKNQSYDKFRMEHLARNKTRNSQNNFSVSHLDENKDSKNLTTITKSIYHQPPTDALTLHHEKAPVTKYRYLDTDSALLKPRNSPCRSEVKEKFGTPIASNNNALSTKDLEKPDNSSHFSFGTDTEGRTTEQGSQFIHPMKLDPKTKAAGVKVLGTSAFAKIYDKESESSSYLHTGKNNYSNREKVISIMQNDYKPLMDRGFTSPQQKLIQTLAKYPPKIYSSHFFHMDNSEGRLTSRTKTDFIPPDRGNFATM